MANYYLDKRVLVNGKTSHIELSNFVNLNTLITSVARQITDVIKTDGVYTTTLSATANEAIVEYDNGTDLASVVIYKNVGISKPGIILSGVPTYANEAAATAAGLVSGTVYKTSVGDLMIKL